MDKFGKKSTTLKYYQKNRRNTLICDEEEVRVDSWLHSYNPDVFAQK